jgi:hypothetical protein
MASDATASPGSLPAWKWTGAQTLEFVYALNERCLQVLGKRVTEEDCVFPECDKVELMTGRKKLWLDLNDAALRRAAKCPFLLIDMRFQNEMWWREVGNGSDSYGDNSGLNVFPTESARELSAETLTLAWHTARLDARIATQVLGLSPRVVAIIASFGPREVQRISTRHAHHLRPRWGSDAAFWEQLLRTAVDDNAASLSEFHLHGLQLLGGDLLDRI